MLNLLYALMIATRADAAAVRPHEAATSMLQYGNGLPAPSPSTLIPSAAYPTPTLTPSLKLASTSTGGPAALYSSASLADGHGEQDTDETDQLEADDDTLVVIVLPETSGSVSPSEGKAPKASYDDGLWYPGKYEGSAVRAPNGHRVQSPVALFCSTATAYHPLLRVIR